MITRAQTVQNHEKQELFEILPYNDAMITPEEWQTLQQRLQDFTLEQQARQTDCQNLTTALNRLNEYRQQVDPASKNALNQARIFKGRVSDNWAKWLNDFNQTSTACRWNDARKIEILPSLLKEHAEKIYQAVHADLTVPQRQDFVAITQALSQRFNTPDTLRVKAAQFHQCRQLVGESADAFADRLQDIHAEAYPNVQGDDRNRMLLDAFMDNLLPNLKTVVLCNNPQALNAAVAAARRFELQGGAETINAALLSTTIPAIASLLSTKSPTVQQGPPSPSPGPEESTVEIFYPSDGQQPEEPPEDQGPVQFFQPDHAEARYDDDDNQSEENNFLARLLSRIDELEDKLETLLSYEKYSPYPIRDEENY